MSGPGYPVPPPGAAPGPMPPLGIASMPPLDEVAREATWQQLDPRSILTFPFAQGAPLLVVILIAAVVGGAVEALLIRLGITVVVLVAIGAVHWWRFRYRVVDGRLETRSGLLARRSKVINVDRIRGIDIEAKLAHRIAGVCSLRIEHPGAAGGSRGRNRDSRDRIDAISHAEAERLRSVLLHERDRLLRAEGAAAPAQPQRVGIPDRAERVLFRMPARWLAYAPFSLRMLVLGPVAVGVVLNGLSESGALEHRRLGALASAGWLVLTVATLAVLLGTALVSAVVTYWRWTVSAHGDDIVVTRGLLTRRVTAIERRRLRGVLLREPLPGRPFRAASLQVVLSGVTGSTRASLAPLGARRPLEEFGRTFVADCEVPLERHPAGARLRRVRRGVAVGLVPAVVGVIVAPFAGDVAIWFALAAIPGVGAGACWALASYRSLGHALDERVLTARHGVSVRHTETVERMQPIGVRVRQSIFARRAGVASVDVALVARGFTRISDLADDDVFPLVRAVLPAFPAEAAGRRDSHRSARRPSRETTITREA